MHPMYDIELTQLCRGWWVVFTLKKPMLCQLQKGQRCNSWKAFPIHKLKDYINSFRKARISSKRNENSRYWKIRRDDCKRDECPFSSHYKQQRFIHIPLGQEIVPSAFLRLLHVILSEVTWAFAIFYIDYIVIFSTSYRILINNSSLSYVYCPVQ